MTSSIYRALQRSLPLSAGRLMQMFKNNLCDVFFLSTRCTLLKTNKICCLNVESKSHLHRVNQFKQVKSVQGEKIEVGSYKSKVAEEQHAAVLDGLAEVIFKKCMSPLELGGGASFRIRSSCAAIQ